MQILFHEYRYLLPHASGQKAYVLIAEKVSFGGNADAMDSTGSNGDLSSRNMN